MNSTLNKKIKINSNQIKEAFQLTCIDQSYLNLARFNDALKYLFKPPTKMIHHIFLSKKLFEIIDEDKTGRVSEQEFFQTINDILKDKNYRLILSMKIMMKTPDKFRQFLEIEEIQNYFVNSYIEGFKALHEFIVLNSKTLKSKKVPIPTENQLVNWAKNYEKKIRDEIYKDIKLMDKNIGNKMELNQFKKWITVDHSIYLNYDFIVLPIATSLVELNNIEYTSFQMSKEIKQNLTNNKIYNSAINLQNTKIEPAEKQKDKKEESTKEEIKTKEIKKEENKKTETKREDKCAFGFLVMENDDFS